MMSTVSGDRAAALERGSLLPLSSPAVCVARGSSEQEPSLVFPSHDHVQNREEIGSKLPHSKDARLRRRELLQAGICLLASGGAAAASRPASPAREAMRRGVDYLERVQA